MYSIISNIHLILTGRTKNILIAFLYISRSGMHSALNSYNSYMYYTFNIWCSMWLAPLCCVLHFRQRRHASKMQSMRCCNKLAQSWIVIGIGLQKYLNSSRSYQKLFHHSSSIPMLFMMELEITDQFHFSDPPQHTIMFQPLQVIYFLIWQDTCTFTICDVIPFKWFCAFTRSGLWL